MTRSKDLPLPAGHTSDSLWSGYVCPWCGGTCRGAVGSGHQSVCPARGFVPAGRLEEDILLQEAYDSGYRDGERQGSIQWKDCRQHHWSGLPKSSRCPECASSDAEIQHERLLNGDPE